VLAERERARERERERDKEREILIAASSKDSYQLALDFIGRSCCAPHA